MDVKLMLRTDASARDVVSVITNRIRNVKQLSDNSLLVLGDGGEIIAVVVVNQIEDGLTEVSVRFSRYSDVIDVLLRDVGAEVISVE